MLHHLNDLNFTETSIITSISRGFEEGGTPVMFVDCGGLSLGLLWELDLPELFDWLFASVLLESELFWVCMQTGICVGQCIC